MEPCCASYNTDSPLFVTNINILCILSEQNNIEKFHGLEFFWLTFDFLVNLEQTGISTYIKELSFIMLISSFIYMFHVQRNSNLQGNLPLSYYFPVKKCS